MMFADGFDSFLVFKVFLWVLIVFLSFIVFHGFDPFFRFDSCCLFRWFPGVGWFLSIIRLNDPFDDMMLLSVVVLLV